MRRHLQPKLYRQPDVGWRRNRYNAYVCGLFAALCLVTAIFVSSETCAQTTAESRDKGERAVSHEEFGSKSSASCLIVLHGASGLSLPFYKSQAVYFGEHGFHVLLPRYFDATHSVDATTDNYRIWARVVDDLVSQCHQNASVQKVFLVGYSLGASVALAAGSQGVPVNAIAEWYGSLPDDFFYRMKGMPPLLILHGERDASIPVMNGLQLVKLCDMKQLHCDHHFYPDQAHGFSGKALEDADERTLSFFASVP